ncbi:RNA polymerase sigma factor [Flavilitoribacter nigricans]|uniref:RNA polymerase subunit sigma-24 n=1 Tax=Flavilitoribacter nigricans (strain ATCC 23147 / DSM 23189 / NBRC 102662 / NCIMB 1420 / SS-2) TaxID=1122177 RepID=A0A2D0NIZ9_FLAN2|nr:sigma-70 family RNA polymerase sigma factor [Flavilitoribacter nigricans]PHN07733.1 RNA polymerase subunit sigma-24 [Flavilitoribacter nigricans DSM 23189 = NBRC 102662]
MQENRPNIIQTVREYSQRLFRFIRSRVSTDEDAEDILQDVWYQFSNTAETEVINQVSGWLHRVARNKITDRYRKRRESSIEDLNFEDEDGDALFLDFLMADDDDPELAFMRQLFWEQLEEALNELPENQRDIFVKNELEGITFQQIAEETGENIKTLISRKGYAVKHLRNRLAVIYQEYLD